MSYIMLLSLNVAIMFQFVIFYTRWISYNVVHSQSQGNAPINLNEHTLNLSLTFLLCIYLFFFSINVSSSKLYGPRAWVELPVYKYNACLRYIEIWCFIYYTYSCVIYRYACISWQWMFVLLDMAIMTLLC